MDFNSIRADRRSRAYTDKLERELFEMKREGFLTRREVLFGLRGDLEREEGELRRGEVARLSRTIGRLDWDV